jgi:glycerol-3-phosphate acyltransferase PlsY
MIFWIVLTLIGSYLLGSIPTAVIVSRRVKGVDVRTLGDGNMGARNVARTLGSRLGTIVALVDLLKGAASVLLAQALHLPQAWQMMAGATAVVGHDFPIFAGFQGGQGYASTVGVFLVLFPEQTTIGMIVYGLLYLITRKPDIAAGVGCGLIALQHLLLRNWSFLAFTVALLVFIPIKKIMDHKRVEQFASLHHSKK